MIFKRLFLFKNFDSNFSFFAPFSLVLGLILLVAGGIEIYNSPIDYQQGNAVKIMYIHVPAAWMALIIYSLMAIFNLSGFIYKNPFFYLISVAIAPIGAIFTLVTLITGSIWGKPIWGSWWVWDARLTSVLILFFLYLGYIILTNSFDDYEKGQKIAAIISIIGFINIPFIKFSVEYFNSLHQKASILRSGGISIDKSMLIPLLIMFGCYFCYFVFFSIIAVKTAVIDKKLSKFAIQELN